MASEQAEEVKICLSIKHLKLVRHILRENNFSDANWFDLGLELDLIHSDLKTIEYNHKNDAQSCMRECLSSWLNSSGIHTWETLATALEKMKQKAVAEHIRKIYTDPASQIVQYYSDRFSQCVLPHSSVKLLSSTGLVTDDTRRKIESLGCVLVGDPLRELLAAIAKDHEKLLVLLCILYKSESTKSLVMEMLPQCRSFFLHDSKVHYYMYQHQSLFVELDEMREDDRRIKSLESDITRNSDFMYQVKVTKHRKIDHPKGTCTLSCAKCDYTCLKACHYRNNEDKWKCSVMRGDESNATCTVCPHRCSWRYHFLNPYYFELYEEIETRRSEELYTRYCKAKSDLVLYKAEVERRVSKVLDNPR